MNNAVAKREYDLSDVDLLRERMGVGYRNARDALEAADGNVVDALVWLEENTGASDADLNAFGERIAEKVREVMAGREITDIRMTLLDKMVCQFTTALGGRAAAVAVVLGELISHCCIELQYGPVGESEPSDGDVSLNHSGD